VRSFDTKECDRPAKAEHTTKSRLSRILRLIVSNSAAGLKPLPQLQNIVLLMILLTSQKAKEAQVVIRADCIFFFVFFMNRVDIKPKLSMTIVKPLIN
jgi:hypothetical protein